MSSSNLDEKVLLQYIIKCLQNWGMNYMNQSIIKKSKKNEDDAIEPMTRLLFDLSLLHIFNYDYFIDQLNITFQPTSKEMLQIILAHLYQIESPFININPSKQDQDKMVISFDFTSSRYILIACGWVMAVSNFFSQTMSKLFVKKFMNIYKPKPLNFTSLSQKYTNVIKNINLHTEADKLSRISYLSKILKGRKYSVECLIEKKRKILGRLKMQLKSIDVNLNIQDVLSSGNNKQIQSLETELRQALVFEKQNIDYRKYWWIWLDQKIIDTDNKEMKDNFQDYSRLEAMADSIRDNITINLNFVAQYLDSLDNLQNKLQTVTHKIDSLNIKSDKNFKEIQREIKQDIKTEIQKNDVRQIQIPSFIGMQLKKYMNLQEKNTEVEKPTKKAINKSIQKSYKKLSDSIKNFISQIDAIVII